MRARIGDPGAITAIRAEIGALAMQVTGNRSGKPETPLEGKFDLNYCIALALHGHDASAADFRDPWHPEPAICATARKIRATISPDMGFASARLIVDLADGRSLTETVPVAKGHPGNPIGWDAMRAKFDGLVAPVLGARATALFGLVREFGGGTLDEIRAILARL